MMNRLKPVFGLLAAGSAGFYLGGRYVGEKAKPTLSVLEPQPQWVLDVKPVLWAVLGLFALSVVAWIIFDYTEDQHREQ